jgi:hypothetical protein
MENGYIPNEFIRLTPRGPYVAGVRITMIKAERERCKS